MLYAYDDEDNAPMNIEDHDGHNPTVYGSYAEMRAAEQDIPFAEPPRNGCWNCLLFDVSKEACSREWNNNEPEYYVPDRDDRKIDDYCDDWEKDEDAVWEDFFDDEYT